MTEHPSERPSSEQLVLRAQAGDASATASLLIRYRESIRRRAASMTVSGMEADDLMQEGMIGLVQAIRSFDSTRGTPFSAYAAACIGHRMLGAAKAAGRRKNLPLNRYLPLDEASERVEAAGEGGNPESLVIRREEAEALRQRIAGRLSDFEQSVFFLYLTGCSYGEMARRLGRPVKAVDNALQRTRRKLAAMDPDDGGEIF